MKINEYILKIKELGACSEAVEAARCYKTSQELWLDCKRGDWMLWLVGRLSGGPGSEKRKRLVLTACKCARLALPYVQKDELRPLRAIETAGQWARGENNITLDDVRAAASAANAAAYAAYAANAAAYAAYTADTAYAVISAQCANIVRTDYPNVDELWN